MASAPASTASRPRLLWWLAATLVVLGYAALAAFHVTRGAMNVDEGFYAAATRAVWQGEMPYRDFGFTQTPLVPYLNAPLLGVAGFGLFQQRVVNGLWGALALLLAARAVARRGGVGWSLVLVAVFALSPAWMYFTHLGKTYGATSALAIAATVVFLEWAPGWKITFALSALAALGVGCRLASLPFFAMLWLAALWDGAMPRTRDVTIAVGTLLACLAAVALPFYLAAPEQSIFWTIDFHRISVPKKDWRLAWSDLVTFAPAIWGLASLAAGLGAVARRPWPYRETVVALAALLALATNLLPQGVYEEYGVPFLPPLAVAALLLLAPILAGWSRAKQMMFAASLLVAPLAIIPALNWQRLAPTQRQFPSAWLPRNAPPYNPSLADNLRRDTELIKRLVPEGAPFIGSAIILGVEAGRPIPPRLRMGAFTMSADYSAEQAQRLHLMTYSDFESLLRSMDVNVIGLHADPLFNFRWSVPSFTQQPAESVEAWNRLFARYFVVAGQDADFVVLARPYILPPPPSR
jgi:hypothetical protein